MSDAASQPTIPTARLILRPFGAGDVGALRAAGEVMISGTDTQSLPTDAEAEAYIAARRALYDAHRGVAFAVEEGGALCGHVGLLCDFPNRNAALLFEIFPAWQGRGHATEALRCLIGYSFGYFRIGRVHAEHLASNPAAGRVLEKIGFPKEGYRREHCFRPGMGPQDLVEYGMLLHEWAEVAHGTA